MGFLTGNPSVPAAPQPPPPASVDYTAENEAAKKAAQRAQQIAEWNAKQRASKYGDMYAADETLLGGKSLLG